MVYIVKFTYMDKETIDVSLNEKQLDNFCQTVRDNGLYWTSDEKTSGMWVNMNEVRFFQIFKQGESESEFGSVQSASNGGDDGVSEGNDSAAEAEK